VSAGTLSSGHGGIIASPVSFQSLDRVAVYAFQKHHQVRSLDFDRLVLAINKAHIGELEVSNFQALSEECKPIHIPPEYLDEIATLAAKEKQVA
jgi:hypothetical protein